MIFDIDRSIQIKAMATQPFLGRPLSGGAKGTAFEIAKVVEQEQRMVADAAEVPLLSRALLLTIGRADGAIHVEHDLPWQAVVMNPIDPHAG